MCKNYEDSIDNAFGDADNIAGASDASPVAIDTRSFIASISKPHDARDLTEDYFRAGMQALLDTGDLYHAELWTDDRSAQYAATITADLMLGAGVLTRPLRAADEA